MLVYKFIYFEKRLNFQFDFKKKLVHSYELLKINILSNI